MNNILTHSGIKGMRWGERKARVITNIKTTTKLSKSNLGSKIKTNKPNLSGMSNTELKSKIERLQLEKQYRDLTSPTPSATKKLVTDALSSAFKQTATVYTAKYMAKGLGTIIK